MTWIFCGVFVETVLVYLELASLLILGQVAVRLEDGVGSQPDILEVFLADWVLPVGQPCDSLVMPHLCPLLAGVGVLRNRLPLACCVQRNLSWISLNDVELSCLVLVATIPCCVLCAVVSYCECSCIC